MFQLIDGLSCHQDAGGGGMWDTLLAEEERPPAVGGGAWDVTALTNQLNKPQGGDLIIH